MAPKFALFTKGSKLPLNKCFKYMFEVLQSCAQPSICAGWRGHSLFVNTFCLCWGFMAQSSQWGHVKHSQYTKSHFYWAGLVLEAVKQYCPNSFTRNWKLPFLNQQKGENDPVIMLIQKNKQKKKQKKTTQFKTFSVLWRSGKFKHFFPNLQFIF